jgi:hypothetical protein
MSHHESEAAPPPAWPRPRTPPERLKNASENASIEEGVWKKAKNGAIIKAKKEVKLTPEIK